MVKKKLNQPSKKWLWKIISNHEFIRVTKVIHCFIQLCERGISDDRKKLKYK